MNKEIIEHYEKLARDLQIEVETCNYSDNYQLVCILAKMADLITTLFQEIKETK